MVATATIVVEDGLEPDEVLGPVTTGAGGTYAAAAAAAAVVTACGGGDFSAGGGSLRVVPPGVWGDVISCNCDGALFLVGEWTPLVVEVVTDVGGGGDLAYCDCGCNCDVLVDMEGASF